MTNERMVTLGKFDTATPGDRGPSTIGSIQDLYPYPSIERGYHEPSQERALNLMAGEMVGDKPEVLTKRWYLLIAFALGYFVGRAR